MSSKSKSVNKAKPDKRKAKPKSASVPKATDTTTQANKPGTAVTTSTGSYVDPGQDGVNISGTPRFTESYEALNEAIRVRIGFKVTFWTHEGKVNASYVEGRKDTSVDIPSTEAGFKNELLNFRALNDTNQDTPTFQITLSGMRDWEEVILPNDYVMLEVFTWDDVTQAGNSDVLITGLVSDVHKEQGTNGYNFVVTSQGAQKILANINLGLPEDIAVNNGILLYDLGAPTSSGDDGGDTSTGAWDGKVPTSVKKGLEAIAASAVKWGKKYGVLPSLCIACAWAESRLGTDPNSSIPLGSNNMWGMELVSVGNGTTGSAKDTKFSSLDEGVKYWMSALAHKSPGGDKWNISCNLAGITKFSTGVDKLTSSNYMGDKTTYSQRMNQAYKSLNLKKYDDKIK